MLLLWIDASLVKRFVDRRDKGLERFGEKLGEIRRAYATRTLVRNSQELNDTGAILHSRTLQGDHASCMLAVRPSAARKAARPFLMASAKLNRRLNDERENNKRRADQANDVVRPADD
jgi:hypothetical protein